MLNSQSRLRRMQALHTRNPLREDGVAPPDSSIDPPAEGELVEPEAVVFAAESETVEFAAVPIETSLALGFARDCGAGEGLSLRVEQSGAPSRGVAVPSGLVLVGRNPRCSLQLPGSAVADKHLLALFLQGEFFVCDLGSPGGTWVDSERLTSGWLPAGTALRVGDSRLVLEGAMASGPAAPAADEQETDETELADELWLTHSHGNEDQRYRLRRPVTLFGRDSRCRVRIRSRSVSRFHCVLVRTSSGVWVADLASREGIRVNGEPVDVARIDDDCELTIGTTSLQLRRGDDADEPVHFRAAGQVSEEFVRELLSEFRKAQRETIAEMGALVRDVLRDVSHPGQAEAVLQKIEQRLTGTGPKQ